jgi:hypothetical protein
VQKVLHYLAAAIVLFLKFHSGNECKSIRRLPAENDF